MVEELSGTDVQMFANRLQKNARRYLKWAKKRGLTAVRLYDRDIPEFPFVVEWYDGRVHLVEYPRRKTLREGTLDAQRAAVLEALTQTLEVPPERVFTKTHLPHAWGRSQYAPTGQAAEPFVVQEGDLRFKVDLAAHLDTGLYLDHRDTRARVRQEAAGKRFLNLFAYTGSFTVAAAKGGAASTTTVDLSNTYVDWAEENLRLNGLEPGPKHRFVRADVLQWLDAPERDREEYDLVVLDPPPFSTSKKMQASFNVQRDHPRLLLAVASLIAPDGVLYFSTNYQGFRLQPEKVPGAHFEELTPRSLPEDIQRKESHRLWRVTRAKEDAARGEQAPNVKG